LFGFPIFEPMVIATNSIFFTLCFIYFKRLSLSTHPYGKQMARFILCLGTSSVFGAICHAVHYQLGPVFFNVMFFIMNALSLFSIYFCFRAAYTYYNLKRQASKTYIYIVLAWVLILLVFSGIKGDFTVIKIHAGIVLLYSLIVHYITYKRYNDGGSSLVVTGIVISFIPIIVHSLRFSLHEWFNYKDIAHVIMIVSLIVIYKGAHLNALWLENSGSGKSVE
jgi:hypothetical protein